jgi:hypothetical protein
VKAKPIPKPRETGFVNRETGHLSETEVKANLERVGNIIKSIGGK